MKPRDCFAFFLALLPLFFLSGCNDAAEDEIRDVFDTFDRLTDAKDGAGALELIDEKYLEQMDYLINAARTAPRQTVYKMRPSERLWIAAIRNRIPKDEMAKLDGRAFYKLTIDQGWDLEDEGEKLELSLGEIKFKKPRATAEMFVEGLHTGLRFEFVEVDHKWKIDPSCIDQYQDKVIEKLASRSGFREDTWIRNIEGSATGHPISEAIWDPPK